MNNASKGRCVTVTPRGIDALLSLRSQIANRNSQFAPQLERAAEFTGGAARARHLYVLEDGVNLRKKLVGPVRFADYTGEPAGKHALNAVLGLSEKAGAQ